MLAVAALAATAACASQASEPPHSLVALSGTPGGPATSRDDLNRTIAAMRSKLAAAPHDSTAAIRLSDALLRQTRVTGNAGLASEAAQVLLTVLKHDVGDYNARRMLGAVYLSEHRFRDAIREAERCLRIRPDDAWIQGVLGDAHIELGEYPDAFAAFERMAAIRPNAGAYARASYARELQGDLKGALSFMQMAAEATSAQDPESLAWHHAQIGHLHLEAGRLEDARREYAHADFVFPGHPFAIDGLARVDAAEGHYVRALERVQARIAESPAPSEIAFAGDLLDHLGRHEEAEQQFRLAEASWMSDAPEPSRFARFLAEHGRHIDRALTLLDTASADRHDIFTEDARAWAYFQVGQLDRAHAAARQALRTGTLDKDIREHAAAIDRARRPNR